MSLRTTLSKPTVFCWCLLWVHAAVADEVIMTNGDRLTGRILQTRDDAVVLETAYTGVIEIERSQVRSLRRGPATAKTETADPAGIGGITDADGSIRKEPPRAAARAEPGMAPAFTPGSEFNGRINVAFASEDGNNDKDELDVDYELGYRKGWHRVESIGAAEFDTDGGEETTENWSVYSRYSRHFPSRWYGAAWLAVRHDRFADLRLRTLGGPALGYLAFESEELSLSFEAGPMALRDDFYDQDDQNFLGPGWFLDFEHSVWQGRLQPYHRQFGYVAVSGGEKRLWQSWTGLRTPLARGFVGSVEFEYDYDSTPALEAETTDTTLRLKLGYQW